ncbi:MAG: CHAD domain-containing protein [Candidatus Omnitrophica bacterium]|nr:CHAD domain-containing protein [Candidatus Omnitrophota bacterium]
MQNEKIHPQSHAQKTLSCYLNNFLKEKTRVQNGTAIEPLHRMRVASRRLRAALKAFQAIGLLPAKETLDWSRRISLVGRALGEARELDIQLRFLFSIKRQLKNKHLIVGINELAEILQERRAIAQKKILDVLDQFKTINFQSNLSKAESLNKPLEIKRRDVIIKKLSNFLHCEDHVYKPKKTKLLHHTRIAAKKLRYVLEIFKSSYGKKINPAITAARRIQDVLGDLHELDVWLEYFPKLKKKGGQSKNLKRAVFYLEKTCTALRAKTYKDFIKEWECLKEKNTWEHLKKII